MKANDINTLRKTFVYSNSIKNKSLDNINDYIFITNGPAYKDFTPRTISGSKKDKVKNVLNNLAKDIYLYIHNYDQDYETWHKQTCDDFIMNYNKQSGTRIQYGKAQKILNMTMKYLYCFSDSTKYAKRFKCCHMPLDTYTLNWFCNTIVPLLNDGKTRNERISISKIRNNSWSKLICGDATAKYSYLWLQEEIKKYLNSKSNIKYRTKTNSALTPFEAEFYIWPEQQFSQATSDISKQAVFLDSYPSYTDRDLFNICKSLINELKKYEQKTS